MTSWLSFPPSHLLPHRRKEAHPGVEEDSGIRGVSQWLSQGLSGGTEAKDVK